MGFTPTTLRAAIFRSGHKQIDIAKKAEIHESRLSKIARGHVEPTESERKALSRVLRMPVDELFPVKESVAS